MCEPNSDGKWGLSFHDVEQFFSYGYYGDYGYQHNVNIYGQKPYNGGYYQENEYSNVNNEVLVHSLQQELSALSIADGSKSSNAVEEHLPVSYPVEEHLPVSYPVEEHLPVSYPVEEHLQVSYPVEQFQAFTGNQDWYYGPSPWNYYYAGAMDEETKEMGPSSPNSSPGNESCDGESNSCNFEITDEFELDGEVGKRLNEITYVPHIPKVNGNIPSTDEASSDYQRLLDRLQLYNMVESQVEGDGNCQFRALSDQFYHSPDHHKSVRRRVVIQLKSNPDLYEEYVPMEYADYVRQISKSGEWGDHITLQAAADSYGVKIFVLTSFKDTDFIEILPKVLKSRKVVFLSYWAEVHYNSIYPEGGLPPSGCGKKKKNKKKWWNFKNRDQANLE